MGLLRPLGNLRLVKLMDNKELNQLQQNNEVTLEEVKATQQKLIREINRLNKMQSRVKRKTTLLVAIIAILILVTGTMAWFTLNSFSSIENLTMEITTGVDLRVDIENHGNDIKQYKKVITNAMVNQYLASQSGSDKSLTNLRLDPLTTPNGMPPFKLEKGATKEANSTSYLEYKVWFIASRDMWVHLSSDTATVEGTTTGTTKVSTSSTGAQANIVRAVRISYEADGNAVIYEPNKGSAVAGQTTFDVPTPMSYSNDTRLFHLNELEPKLVTIRVWAEGNDPECNDDVQQANLQVEMLFSGTDDNNTPLS